MIKLSSELFNWIRWRNGSPADLNIICRKPAIIAAKSRIRKYAVGWCNSENCLCRPKVNQKAVMFFKDGIHFWFHLTNEEFNEVFNDKSS
jgi:hypothetical protein